MHRPAMRVLGCVCIAALVACDPPPPVMPTVDAGEKPQQPATQADARSLCQDGMGTLLGSLHEPAEIVLYTTRSEPSISAFTDRVAAVLARFKALSKGKLVYRIVDPKTDADFEAAKEAGMTYFTVGTDDHIAPAFSGIVVRYRGSVEAMPILSPDMTRGVEFAIAKKLREARDRGDKKATTIGVVTKKDEVALSEPNLVFGKPAANLTTIIHNAFPYYRLEDVDVKSAIPADLHALIITQPGRDYSDEELRHLDAFLMRGGSLAIFASAVNLAPADPSMKATLDAHRLDSLLAHYGIDMQIASVLDARAGLLLPMTGEQENVFLRVPSIVHIDQKAATIDSDSPIFFRIEELAVPFASPLVPHAERQPDAKLTILLHSSPDAATNNTPQQDLHFGAATPAPNGQDRHALAITLEGKLKSAFGNTRSTANARLLVVSSSQFLANPYARASNPLPHMATMRSPDPKLEVQATHYARTFLTATIVTFKNLLDWMTNDPRINACSALPLTR